MPTITLLINNLTRISTITFTTESSSDFAGYGPIHVSTAISFFVGLLLLSSFLMNLWKSKKFIYFTSILLSFLMLLTFSRSGLALLIFSAGIAYFYFKKNIKVLIPFLLIYIAFSLIVTPLINELTMGAFEERYAEAPSDRLSIAIDDLRIWGENPFFGVGLTKVLFEKRPILFGSGINSHTEFTRFLAEQGLIGLLSLGIMSFIFLQSDF